MSPKLTGPADGSIDDIAARDYCPVATDTDRDAGQGCTTREGIATLCGIVARPCYLSIVCGNNSRGKVKQRSAGISDGVNGSAGKSSTADCIAIAGELPEPVTGVDINVRDSAGVLSRVDKAEVIGARGAFLQVHREKRRSQSGFGISEKGFLLHRRNGVANIEGKTHEPIVVSILLKLGANGTRELDRLTGNSRGANLDGVCVHISARRATISV